MAYDEKLAERIREALAGGEAVNEIRMMGGLCFMVRGHMAVGILGDELMVRVGPEAYERALGRLHAREMDFTGRPTKGFVLVAPAGIATKRSLTSWIAPAVDFAKALPPKGAKPRRKRTARS